ncbi:uncharacterized protein EDB91DRAFT_1209957 [Suillus paluster]|uniref:uncharacterized protein n=1 Tax=Suillus paluster TaxID=48578 RepID=UPI001B871301|nr:uncharacterized protein EDB91DRAFT_1209957 [Suillus paluster]KAG1722935.1 hypothetical protein EDB91DRAFT_1209957 [Suillus paluster]
MMTSVPLPDGFTCALLKEVKGAEIAFWIGQANAAAGKRVVTKNGRVDEQRKRLTDYYGLNLSAEDSFVAAVALKTHEDHIKQRQFSWLQELGEEWASMAACGKEFFLCDRSSEPCNASLLQEAVKLLMNLMVQTMPSAAPSPLSLDGRTQTENNEMISALIGAACDGDSTAISRLSSLGNVSARLPATQMIPQCMTAPSVELMVATLPPAPLSNAASLQPTQQLWVLLPTIPSMAQSVPPVTIFAQPGSLPLVLRGDGSALLPFIAPNHTATMQTSSSLSVPLFTEAPVVLPCTVNDVAVLNSCQLDIESIQCAQDLCDAIQQVEDGTVSRVHERYGPRDGRATDEMWGHLKGKITKRERLYGLLAGAFEGDRDRFFEYFTPTLVALRMVVEAIPHCQKDLQDERRNTRYVDLVSGKFSKELWRAVWGDRNDWYVWRELGKEWYGNKKA